ncbi:MAG: glycoside hydrolase family 38 C-terminal domain-containing protein [Gloeomargarita sp. SKYBB_i_bin120]|nr:glycosyl hydrolase-related protein [Gloeomargarita sp. SKYG98]MCS7292666.1 glycosyl hydrolase-related protein [Gloeomargarita sp. SKYB120]MDW8178228.1 glycoside hydrolase family 38 C-terminal domain-containing protein [Gloeomargarita sp. SKYBB_i_bin120]
MTLAVLLATLQRLAYPAVLPLPQWEIAKEPELAWQTVEIPATWGGYNQTVWWRKRVTLPTAWRNRPIALRMDIPEGLVFLEQQPYSGLDRHHPVIVLPPDLGPEFTLQIQADSGRTREPPTCRFSELVVIDPEAEKLWTWLAHLQTVQEAYPWVQAGLQAWLATVETTAIDVPTWLKTLPAALRAQTTSPATPHIYLVGHSHLDVVWLWTLDQTRRKVGRTFSTALNLLQEFPHFYFLQTQAQLYRYCQQDYPEIYRHLKAQVQVGRWCVEGAVWVEPDGNLISGESWVRQLVYGQRFFQQEFNVTCRVLWLPDSFGYHGNLPQLLQQAGISYFFTTKLNWNDTQAFPYASFWWQGIDGTRVLAHQPPVGLEGLLSIPDLDKTGQRYAQKEVAPVVLQTFGYGDGGGGVTRQHLQLSELLQSLNLPYPHQISDPVAFFTHLERYGDRLPTWQGELYLEKHRGTYTTHSRVKQQHRQAEREFYLTELLATYAWLAGAPYPATRLDQCWQQLLLLQFHDILPGTFIADAYPQVMEDFAQIRRDLSALRQEALDRLRAHPIAADTWTVWNVIHALENADVFLPVPRTLLQGNRFTLRANGQVIPHQVLTATSPVPSLYPEHHPPGCTPVLCRLPTLPAYSSIEIHWEPTTVPDAQPPYAPTVQHLENEWLRLTLDAQGNLRELWDKRLQRNCLAPGQAGAEICLFLDRPRQWEAWDIDADYAQHPSPTLRLTGAQVVEQGPLRQGVAFAYEVHQENGLHCRLQKSLYLYRDKPFVECFVAVDLTQNNYAPFVMKLRLPVDLDCEQATFDIPFGMIRRSTTHPAQFEVPALTWADLSGPIWGMSVLSRDKYGFSVGKNCISLTLLRVAHYPHPQEPWHLTDTAITDTGTHMFCCRFYPHAGDVTTASIPQQAREFLYPPLGVPGRFRQPLNPLVTLDTPHVCLAAVKKAMASEAMVLRLYETRGQPTQARLVSHIPVREIWECDLQERPQRCLGQGAAWTLDFSPFQVKTLLLWPG